MYYQQPSPPMPPPYIPPRRHSAGAFLVKSFLIGVAFFTVVGIIATVITEIGTRSSTAGFVTFTIVSWLATFAFIAWAIRGHRRRRRRAREYDAQQRYNWAQAMAQAEYHARQHAAYNAEMHRQQQAQF